MNNNVKIIGLDADDTLWDNEIYFRSTEERFCEFMEPFCVKDQASAVLLETERKNISLYGYGIKSFILSMIEASLKLSNGKCESAVVERILALGKSQLNEKPVILDGVMDFLAKIPASYRLVVATKGDLLDQTRKLKLSGLEKYFHHVEIMCEKNEEDYSCLLQRLGAEPENFMMIGNSLKSDVIPVLNIGAHAVHIPYHTLWLHEKVDTEINNPRFRSFENLRDVIQLLS